jgi:hypothetical protein
MGAQFGAINTFIQGLAIAHDYVKVFSAAFSIPSLNYLQEKLAI